jgi:hypothetical protein
MSAPDDPLADRIDAKGHQIHTGWLMAEIRQMKAIHEKLSAEAVEKGEKAWSSYGESLRSESRQCHNCGGTIFFRWDGDDDHPPVVSNQIPYSGGTYKAYRPRLLEDLNTPCPTPVLEPVVLRFTCKSGRIALANDLRETIIDARKTDLMHSINSHAGKVEYMKWYANHGYMTGFVGNTGIDFVPCEGGLDVAKIYSDNEEDDAKREALYALEESAVHHVSTELWWFVIVDAADLPEGATDSYDREIGFMDLPPGDYDFTVFVGSGSDDNPDTLQTCASLRRVVS